MDQRKGWRAAERLLKQGKVQAALQQLSKISDAAAGDIVTLNRLADLLAQQGKPDAAIGYYEKIANQFESGGFIPKAVAIHKKILRLDPKRLGSAIHLGQLYGRQKLLGEARKYLLHAANCYVEKREFDKAREVFERLVEAEPNELRHRVRLAESRAAEGDTPKAVDELVWVGEAFLSGDAVEDARTIFEHARELDPASEAALIGSARCCEAEGHTEKALELLRSHFGATEVSGAARGELARLYEANGSSDQALGLLAEAPLGEVRPDTWERMFKTALERGDVDPLWERMDPLFQSGPSNGGADSLLQILSRLVDLEPEGHVPALLRQARLYEESGEVRNAVRALDALAHAYRARSMDAEAARVLERMREVAPPGEEPAPSAPVIEQTAHAPAPDPVPLRAPPPRGVSRASDSDPVALEAPAVPISPADEEFASGRITQAEVLEKYDLLSQALEQLDEVVARFPGHVMAQERRVEMLRLTDQKLGLTDALTALASARRAVGDIVGAKKAATEAAAMPELRTVSRRMLEKLQLIRPPASAATTEPEGTAASPIEAAPTSPPEVEAVPPAPPEAPADTPSAAPEPEPPAQAPVAAAPADGSDSSTSGEVVIDLDDDDEVSSPDASASEDPAATPAASVGYRPPAPEMLADIRHEMEAGNHANARRRLNALVVLGYSGPELEGVRRDIEVGEASSTEALAPEAPVTETRAAEAMDSHPVDLSRVDADDEEDSLAAIRAALEEELADEPDLPMVPEGSSEQGVDEILAAFRERVDEEVGSEDKRTHYELGIGFKEMGLIDEAIAEFQIAIDAPDLQSAASAMIAVCHRERDEMEEAVKWYRAAVEASPPNSEETRSLRYDLAEVLLESGEVEEALSQFRGVLDVDPTFRDVSGRVDELESRLQS